MTSLAPSRTFAASPLAWPAALLAGLAGPALAMWPLAAWPAPAPLALVAGPLLALGLMAIAMIGTAASGRFGTGVLLALLAGASLIAIARLHGMPPLPHPVSTGFAMVIASLSFAARGRLFARSAARRGWWIALFVVAGEAAILLTAAAMPGALPAWLLALLPAQWATTAIQTALTGTGTRAAGSALAALAGTAAVTLLVARLLPRRWPYALMFTAWLGLSALVWHRPGPPMPRADLALAKAASGPVAPIAAGAPDAATRSALARVQRQIAK